MSLSPLRYGPVKSGVPTISFEAYDEPGGTGRDMAASVGVRPRSRSGSQLPTYYPQSEPIMPAQIGNTAKSHWMPNTSQGAYQPSGLVSSTPGDSKPRGGSGTQPYTQGQGHPTVPYEDPDAHMRIGAQDRSVALMLPTASRPHASRSHIAESSPITDPFGSAAIFGSLYRYAARADGGGEDAAIWVDIKVIEDGLPTIHGAMIALILCRDSFQLLVPKTKFTMKVEYSDIFKIELEQNIRLVIHCGLDSHRQYLLDFRGSNNRVMLDEQIAPKLFTILSSVITPRSVRFPARPDVEYLRMHTALRSSEAFETTTGLKVAGKQHHPDQSQATGVANSGHSLFGSKHQGLSVPQHQQLQGSAVNDSVDTVYNAYNEQKAEQRSMALTNATHGAHSISHSISRAGAPMPSATPIPRNGWSPFDHSTYANGLLADDEDLSNTSSRRHSVVLPIKQYAADQQQGSHAAAASRGTSSAAQPYDQAGNGWTGDTIQLVRKTSSGLGGMRPQFQTPSARKASHFAEQPTPNTASKNVLATPAVTVIARGASGGEESADNEEVGDGLMDIATDPSSGSENDFSVVENTELAEPSTRRGSNGQELRRATINSVSHSTATGSDPPHAAYGGVPSISRANHQLTPSDTESLVRVRVADANSSRRPSTRSEQVHVRAFTVNPSDIDGDDYTSKASRGSRAQPYSSVDGEAGTPVVRGASARRRKVATKPNAGSRHSPQREAASKAVEHIDSADYYGSNSPLTVNNKAAPPFQGQGHPMSVRVKGQQPPANPMDNAYTSYSLSSMSQPRLPAPYPAALQRMGGNAAGQLPADFTFSGPVPVTRPVLAHSDPYNLANRSAPRLVEERPIAAANSPQQGPQQQLSPQPRRSHSQGHHEFLQNHHHSSSRPQYKSIMLRLNAYDAQRGREALLKAMEGSPANSRAEGRVSVDKASSPLLIPDNKQSFQSNRDAAGRLDNPPAQAAAVRATRASSPTTNKASDVPYRSPAPAQDGNDGSSASLTFVPDPMRVDISAKAVHLAHGSLGVVGAGAKGMAKAVTVPPSAVPAAVQRLSHQEAADAPTSTLRVAEFETSPTTIALAPQETPTALPEQHPKKELEQQQQQQQQQYPKRSPKRSVSPPIDIATVAAAKAAAIRLRQQQERAAGATPAQLPGDSRTSPSPALPRVPSNRSLVAQQHQETVTVQPNVNPTEATATEAAPTRVALKSTSSSVQIMPSPTQSASSSASSQAPNSEPLGPSAPPPNLPPAIANPKEYLPVVSANNSFGGSSSLPQRREEQNNKPPSAAATSLSSVVQMLSQRDYGEHHGGASTMERSERSVRIPSATGSPLASTNNSIAFMPNTPIHQVNTKGPPAAPKSSLSSKPGPPPVPAAKSHLQPPTTNGGAKRSVAPPPPPPK